MTASRGTCDRAFLKGMFRWCGSLVSDRTVSRAGIWSFPARRRPDWDAEGDASPLSPEVTGFLSVRSRRDGPPGRYAARSSERARSTWPASIQATAVASMTIRARPTRHRIFFRPRMKWRSKP